MSDAPERIWADPPETFDGCDVWHSEPAPKRTEYIRKDVADAAALAERRACAKVAEYRWREWSKRPDPHGDVVCDVTACENIASAILARTDTNTEPPAAVPNPY